MRGMGIDPPARLPEVKPPATITNLLQPAQLVRSKAMTAARKRRPSLAREVTAVIKAGLLPRLEQRPDGSVVLTGLPSGQIVHHDSEGEALDRLMDNQLGTGDGHFD